MRTCLDAGPPAEGTAPEESVRSHGYSVRGPLSGSVVSSPGVWVMA